MSRRNATRQNPTRLWRCPKCGECFVTANMWHSCGKFSLETLFRRAEPHVVELFSEFEKMVRKCGPVHMIPQKTRVVFQVRIRFAGCYPRRNYLLCTIILPHQTNDPRFIKIERFALHCVLHYFHVRDGTDLDTSLQKWLHESYRVGGQERLKN